MATTRKQNFYFRIHVDYSTWYKCLDDMQRQFCKDWLHGEFADLQERFEELVCKQKDDQRAIAAEQRCVYDAFGMNTSDGRVDSFSLKPGPICEMMYTGRGFEVCCSFGHLFGVPKTLAAMIQAQSPATAVLSCPTCQVQVLVKP